MKPGWGGGRVGPEHGGSPAMPRSPGFISKTTENEMGSKAIRCVIDHKDAEAARW